MELNVLHFVYLAASDGDETIWVQMLMVVILAAGGGIYAFIKTRPGPRRGSRGPISIHRNIFNRGIDGVSRLIKTTGRQIPLNRPAPLQGPGERRVISRTSNINYQTPAVIETVVQSDTQRSGGPASETKKRDLKSGMELLQGGFLVKIVEQPANAAGLDIEMQKMCFAEMQRRNELEAVSSEALETYTIDEAGHYGKTIQRQAMEELFRRTAQQHS
jgi:hypothetical protein